VQKLLSHLRVSTSKARLNYGYMWKAMINTMSFLVQHAQSFHQKEIFAIADKV